MRTEGLAVVEDPVQVCPDAAKHQRSQADLPLLGHPRRAEMASMD